MKNPLILLALVIITSCTVNSSDKTKDVGNNSNIVSAYFSGPVSNNERNSVSFEYNAIGSVTAKVDIFYKR